MEKINFTFFVIGIAVVAILAYVGIFNALVKLRQKVRESWSGIDVQLKRRYNLIPNLVNTVKGYAAHESGTLEKVIAARNAAMSVPKNAVTEKSKAENMLSSTLKSIFALSENYPDLKADKNFLELQRELTETEDQIAAARRIYNGNVSLLNTKIEQFPSNLVAGFHHFEKEPFFEIDENERDAVSKVPEIRF